MFSFLSRLRRRRVVDVAELRAFLLAEAALLSQRSTYGYCEARAGSGWFKLVQEPAFVAALEACRWQAFAAVLADIVLVAETLFRPYAPGERDALGTALAGMYREMLASSPAPAGVRPELEAISAAFPARMARAQLGEPHEPAEIARVGGERLFELLPIHPSLRQPDREAVINSVRFGMIGFWEKLNRSVDRPAELVARLIGAPASGKR